MEVFKSELHVFPLRAYMDATRAAIGDEGLESILSRYGVSASQLMDPNAWVSRDFCEAFLRDMVERCPDPDHFRRATEAAMTRKYMGPLLPLLSVLGTPLFMYQQAVKLGARFNKIGTWTFDEGRTGFARLTFRRAPHLPPEREPYLCMARETQFRLVPTLFGHSPGTVDHTHCMLRGDDVCTYEIKWNEPAQRRDGMVGALAGAALGLGAAALAGLSAQATLVAIAFLATGGWAIGRLRVVRADLAARVDEIKEHNAALENMMRANEQRYAEVVEAKAAVEQKVEERTAALSLATEQLSKTLTQVQELDRAKTAFFSNVSHDLRTPLTLILGPLGEMTQGREPPGGLSQAVDVMHRNGMRLLDLINQLLDLAKIDAGKMQIARNPTDVVELARNVESRFAAAATQRGVSLSTTAATVLPIAIDSAWIENALTNLVANAIRFARTQIMIKVREDEGAVVLEVEDDGQGIAEKDLNSVFDRFAQGSDMQARKGGTGLGLAIVREAARLHGGDASVRSMPGIATTFTLTLPRSMAADAAGHSVRPPAAESEMVSAPSSTVKASVHQPGALVARVQERTELYGQDASAPLIVVAEDDDDLRAFTSQVLSSTFRVRATRNGEEALAAITELHPDAVVSDVVMPKMDGYDLCKALRKRDDTRTLPIILVTARRDVGRVLEGFDAGADDYVTKPFQARELLARVNVHVRLRRLVSEMAHRERLASLGVLAASLAHQVRNPLNAILAGLPAVRRKLAAAIDRRDDDMFAAMIDSGERINTLIKDLMDLSRVDQEVVSRFRPADGVRSCMRLIEARIQGTVTMDADLDHSVEIQGKAGDLSHVFLNMIDNAVRAAEPSGQIHIAVARRGDGVAFEVGDSGAGIPADKHEAVFAPFYTTRAAGEGTGLGLAIARQVVIQHGGTITIGVSPLGGAQFTVWLPSALASAGAVGASAQTLH